MSEKLQGSWRTVAATVCAVVLIVGAFVIARGVESPQSVQASTETELLEKIAARDVDGDGLPDWEEALYGTDNAKYDTRNLGMSDGEAVRKGLIVPRATTGFSSATSTGAGSLSFDPSLPVPAEGTITRALSESFVTTYAKAVQNSPTGILSDADVKQITKDIISNLDQAIAPAPDYRSLQALSVKGSGQEALRSFAVAAETVFLANKADAASSELVYLKSLLEEDDMTTIPHLMSIAKVYKDTAAGLAVLPVPSELANDDLLLINSMARLGKITEDFTRAHTDPIATMLALKQYPQAIKDLGAAFIHINSIYKTNGVLFVSGEPGADLVNLIEVIVAEQKATNAKKP